MWEWKNVWKTLATAVVVLLLGFWSWTWFQDHTTQFYYLSDRGTGDGRNGYCIDGYRNWWANEVGVFCSDDVNKAISTMNELNEDLRKLRGK